MRTTTYVYPLSMYNVRCFHKYAILKLTSCVRYVHVMALFRECTVRGRSSPELWGAEGSEAN